MTTTEKRPNEMTSREISNDAYLTSEFTSIKEEIVDILSRTTKSMTATQISLALTRTGKLGNDNLRARMIELRVEGKVVVDKAAPPRCPETGKIARHYRLRRPEEPFDDIETIKKTKAELVEEIEHLKEKLDEAIDLANDMAKAVTPEDLPFVRFELKADGKPGMTFTSQARSDQGKALAQYCSDYGVDHDQVVFTKFHHGEVYKPAHVAQ